MYRVARTLRCKKLRKGSSQRYANITRGTQVTLREHIGKIKVTIEDGDLKGWEFEILSSDRHIYIGR